MPNIDIKELVLSDCYFIQSILILNGIPYGHKCICDQDIENKQNVLKNFANETRHPNII